jgi:hypothetical protein
MTATAWTRRATLRAHLTAAEDDTAAIPALLLAMAAIVEREDTGFAEELRDAAADAEDSDTATEDADFWLAQFYDWADAARVWIE